jgi:hypothetical protein
MGRQHSSIDRGLTMLCPLCNSESKYSFSTQYVKVRKCGYSVLTMLIVFDIIKDESFAMHGFGAIN